MAAAALVLREQQVLLIRRANQPGRGLWTLPAGFVDAGEDPAFTAQRECLEETGVQVHVTGVFNVISGREHPRGADILIVYNALPVGGELQPCDDADRVAYFPLHELPPLAFKATHWIMERLRLNHLPFDPATKDR